MEKSTIFVCMYGHRSLTVHSLGRQHSEHVRRRVVLERDSLRVPGWHSQLGVAARLHLELALGECPHGVDPGLLRGVHEAAVDPRGHPVNLGGKRKRETKLDYKKRKKSISPLPIEQRIIIGNEKFGVRIRFPASLLKLSLAATIFILRRTYFCRSFVTYLNNMSSRNLVGLNMVIPTCNSQQHILRLCLHGTEKGACFQLQFCAVCRKILRISAKCGSFLVNAALGGGFRGSFVI